VQRNFKAAGPGQLDVADFTCVPPDSGGFAYTAFVIDACAGYIGGWECSRTKATAFVIRAIRQAVGRFRKAGHPLAGLAIHHSDAGSQYTSVRLAETLHLAGLTGSIGTVGDAHDNALAESTTTGGSGNCSPDSRPSEPPRWKLTRDGTGNAAAPMTGPADHRSAAGAEPREHPPDRGSGQSTARRTKRLNHCGRSPLNLWVTSASTPVRPGQAQR